MILGRDLPYEEREAIRKIVLSHVEELVGVGGEAWFFHPKHLNLMVSSLGQIKVLDTGTLLASTVTTQGYVQAHVPLWRSTNGKRIGTGRHRLVAETFFPYVNSELYEANHINGNKADNSIWNVNWLTRKENLQHARDTGLFKRQMGITNGRYKYTSEQVSDIMSMFKSESTAKEIAAKYSISASSVYHIIHRRGNNENQ